MFKGLGNLGNIANLMKSAQEMGGKMEGINAQLKAERIDADAGGGMVQVQVNGVGEVLKVTIEPSLIEKNEKEMIEDLLAAAINQAAAKAKQRHAEMMQSLTEGIELPGLSDAISKFTGTDPNS
jgi:DNA-binding YbaB/EbfC family protein